jgi:ABC-type branched-subunit amino acid transport system substrate-binding protein
MRTNRALLTLGLILTLALGAVAAASALSTGGSAKPPVKFAIISIGVPGVDLYKFHLLGAQVAANAINQSGGFGGRKVEIIGCNSQFSPSVATVCAHDTLDQGVIAEGGCETSWTASGLAIYGKAGVPSFNCTNATADLTYRWSFGLNAGATGYFRAGARWLCSRSDVHHVVFLGQDYPAGRQTAQDATQSVFAACGKQVDYVFAPLNPADFTPYVQQVLADKPDFVIAQASVGPLVNLLKTFQQAAWPASKVLIGDSIMNYADGLGPAGSAAEGVYIGSQWKTWGDSSDPEVAAYTKAVQQFTSEDPRNSQLVWGYATVMYWYEAAKRIGFDKFTSQKLAQFTRNVNNYHWPMSYKLSNPGPKGAPEVKQPYIQIVQWQGGNLLPVKSAGPNKDGWVPGY